MKNWFLTQSLLSELIKRFYETATDSFFTSDIHSNDGARKAIFRRWNGIRGGGLFSIGISDGFDQVAIGGIQAQFDYDFIEGPYRAAIGIKAMALGGYTFFEPGVKIGKDIINLNISVDSDGLTYYGLSSRIDLSANKQHAVNLSLQGASDIDGYGYALLFVGYSHRFK